MSIAMSKNPAAVIEKPQTQIVTTNRPIPSPGADELLVRNHAVAANPVDWKIQSYNFFAKNYPIVLGSDACGVVVAVGSSVTKFKPGDRVTGFAAVIYNNDINHGAWQTYTILREIATTKIPASMSFEEGSVFPMGFATSAISLFINLGIPRPSASVETQKSGLLIWGASSSVGCSALQIANALGLKVFATASPAHHEYAKSLGAFQVFDYHDSDVVAKISAAAKDAGTPISLGFDTIGEGSTPKQSSDVLLASGGSGSKLVSTGSWPEKESKPEGVEVSTSAAFKLGTDQSELGAWFFNEWLQTALEKGAVVPAPKVQIVDGGIGAAQKAFDMLKAGVSGKKLVVKVE